MSQSRVIKFRAWNPYQQRMMPNSTAYDMSCVFPSQCFDHLMQFTGNRDKNGKDIYEGDIIRCIDPDDQAVAMVVMGKFGWMKQYGNEASQYPLTDFDLHWFEVVGNVYENAKLLEEQE